SDIEFDIDGYKVVLPTYNINNPDRQPRVYFLMKLDLNLNVLWLETTLLSGHPFSPHNRFNSNLVIDNSNSLYLTAEFSGKDTLDLFNTQISNTDSNYWYLLKIDNNSITRSDISAGPYCAGDTLE